MKPVRPRSFGGKPSPLAASKGFSATVTRFSARVEYACLAALELALHYHSGRKVQVRTITARHHIPRGFLVQILRELRNAGLVNSVRGSSGGYLLARPPKEISVWDIVQAVQGSDQHRERSTLESSPLASVFQGLWEQLGRQEEQLLRRTTLDKLMKQLPTELEPMYYI